MPESRKVLIVLGMHRSGTSLLAEALHRCGLGTADKLIAADPQVNARGFWEDEVLVQINEALFSALGQRWFDTQALPADWWNQNQLDTLRTHARQHLQQTYQGAGPFVIKDPRLSRLLPFWQPILKELDFDVHGVVVIRPPLEVASSLRARDSLPLTYGHLLWLRYMQDLMTLEDSLPLTVVDYLQVLQEPQAVVTELLQHCGLGNLQVPDLTQIADKNLHHQHADIQDDKSIARISQQLQESYQQLRDSKSFDNITLPSIESPELTSAISEVTETLVRSAGEAVRIGELHRDAQHTVALRDEQLAKAQQKLEETGKLYESAITAIREKDSSLAELVAEVEQARKVIAERDKQLHDANEARRDLETRLSELYQRLQASILGRLALKATERKQRDPKD